ncbi:MAG: hypothetical protein J7K87_00255 [Candidatus Aenigmarchaeota archaeon]|nr:hypothetical protein [Candidatus Aenigmarchaeota archaeon]
MSMKHFNELLDRMYEEGKIKVYPKKEDVGRMFKDFNSAFSNIGSKDDECRDFEEKLKDPLWRRDFENYIIWWISEEYSQQLPKLTYVDKEEEKKKKMRIFA